MNTESYLVINSSKKEKIISFVWQHLLLLCSLFVMTFGVALCVRSNLGSSVISSVPLAMTHAGEAGKAPGWTIGDYTNVMNIVLVFGQILILRSRFEKMQLFQLIMGQAEMAVHMLNWAIRSVKFLGVEFDQSEDEEVSVSDTTHL